MKGTGPNIRVPIVSTCTYAPLSCEYATVLSALFTTCSPLDMNEDLDIKPTINSDSEVARDLEERDELDDDFEVEEEESDDDSLIIRDQITRPVANTHTARELHGMSV